MKRVLLKIAVAEGRGCRDKRRPVDLIAIRVMTSCQDDLAAMVPSQEISRKPR